MSAPEKPFLMRLLASLQKEPPITLAREALWRARRTFRQRRFSARLGGRCPVEFRAPGFFKPDLAAVNAESRGLILEYCDRLLRGRFTIFGYEEVTLGFPPPWNVDFVAGAEWPVSAAAAASAVRFDGSDVKIPWEISRLQFLPVLGKAWTLTHEIRYRAAAKQAVDDWIEKNPAGLGINWHIAMEASLRAASLCFLLELLSPFAEEEQVWLDRVTASLWHHLLFIESHLEFSHLMRSNHYLSNLFGLAALSCCLRGPGMRRRLDRYSRLLQAEIPHQTYADGGDFEASTGYHVFAAQLFLCGRLFLRARGASIRPEFESRLRAMFSILTELSDDQCRLPQIGDCDDGRAELLSSDLRNAMLPPHERDSLKVPGLIGLGRAIFGLTDKGEKTDAAWFGLSSTQVSHEMAQPARRVAVFEKSRLARVCAGGASVIFCAMPNGIGGKGSHTHNDKLSFTLQIGAHELFCDSGTCVYTRDVKARNEFRSTAAHNTVRVAGLEQNSISPSPLEAFRLGNEAIVSPIEVTEFADGIQFRASCTAFRRIGIAHARTLRLYEDHRLIIEDELLGNGEFPVEMFFQVAPEWRIMELSASGSSHSCRLAGPGEANVEWSASSTIQVDQTPSQISRVYGHSLPSVRLRVSLQAALPARMTTRVQWKP